MLQFTTALIFAFTSLSAAQTEPQQPSEKAKTEYSQYVSQGSGTEYLEALSSNAERLARAEDLELALMILELLPDTTAYLSTPLADALAVRIEQEIGLAIRCTVFADLYCLTGESAAIEAGFARATRFKQISLPIFWKLMTADRNWGDLAGSKERASLHIRRAMRMIIDNTKDLDLCGRRLRLGGFGALADELHQPKPK